MKHTILPLAIVVLASCTGSGSTEAVIDGTTVFDVTAVNAPTSYTINNFNNPTLILQKGVTYTFNLSASGHPFYIMTIQGPNTANAYTSGVTGNGNSTGQLLFAVPMNAPGTLYYDCSTHAAMTGTIYTTN